MRYLADLHIHSPFSRATSRQSTLAGLFAWARVKGIHVLGTGDFTHPGWFRQLREKLEPAEPGFFRLRDENAPPALAGVSPEEIPVRFVLTAEISSIYKRGGKVRKVHNILFAPDFESAARINGVLAGIGNIESDGRPILGLDSRDLLEIQLKAAPEGFLVPAHVWTPWFSLFGSKSGFDSVEECFGDLSGYIFALETGLSSDPDMNRMVSALDRYALISNSDCHSPSRLGRELNIFDTDFDFFSMRDALRNPGTGFLGTMEFFPEEGKYHFDGHRKCGVCLDPVETRRLKNLCPECGKPLTVGVHHRVLELADRDSPHYPDGSPRFGSLIPLPEVLGELFSCGPATKTVLGRYARVISTFGSEFNLLMKSPIEEIHRPFPLLAEAIRRIRESKVIRRPGYDGEFGVIKVFDENELESLRGQAGLFGPGKKRKTEKKTRQPLSKPVSRDDTQPPGTRGLNPEQAAAVRAEALKVLVSAGPGTGKTFTLVSRLLHLIDEVRAAPAGIAAITFTNRAADELRERHEKEAGPAARGVFVGTFHAFCLEWRRRDEPELAVAGPETRERVIRRIFPGRGRAELTEFSGELSGFLQALAGPGAGTPEECPPDIRKYLDDLRGRKAVDIDAVIPFFVDRLRGDTAFREAVAAAVGHLLIDEFQDLNAAQYEMVRIMSGHAGVFAIGDPDQAIYGFRGSDPAFFMDFAREAETLSLRRNYRSSTRVLEAAAGVIEHNGRNPEPLRAESGRTGFIRYHRAPTPAAEAEFVVRGIEEIMGGISHFSINSGRGGEPRAGGTGFSDIAVLVRLLRQAGEITGALERRGIPFQLVGSTPFFMAPEMRAACYFVRAAAGDPDTSIYLALLGELKGVGPALMDRLEELPLRCGDFFGRAMESGLPPAARKTLIAARDALDSFRRSYASDPAAALAGAFSFLRIDPSAQGPCRFIDLALALGGGLEGFASHLEKQSLATVYDERAEAVSVMTLHASKGLEFPIVFITGLEEGLLPHARPDGGHADIEEERRLFYVGLTRAGEGLILTSSQSRTLYGGTRTQRESRFLGEIPPRLVERSTEAPIRTKKNSSRQMNLFEP